MDGALKLALLAALMLLVSAQASNYGSLPDRLRNQIDKSLEKTRNDYPHHHVAYLKIKGKPKISESTLNVNILLKVSECTKSQQRNAVSCVPQKSPLYVIDCLVCKTKENKELVDCSKLKDVEQRLERKKCEESESHLTGGSTLLRQAEDSQIGCLGCM